MMDHSKAIDRLFFTPPRLRGEVGFYAKPKIRVRGADRESVSVESHPYSNPLPVSGERERFASRGGR
jgi:hypothetical protein